ncbi:L-ornithine N5-oxygenase [Arboricoccus pini]|uniref:L-ornithine N5-oxygenase n=1 Tax=Arboricoccus pini TaxID=1963835 RepID=A0A212RK37_9PROT|nr:lysine N(6)-hydroxylase/L-ornithine N(5)-oxygenase family protein [Arboricoccus pini]SNB72808.1 L-ornithine N5-oxygenase [Arboricoccus pini]
MSMMDLDLLGVGFGPANLAVAVAMAETPAARKLNFRFLERQNEFRWHPDMMVEGSTVQISFLKDLATLRDPSSRFTFVNYLHAKKRLEAFINLGQSHPTRAEFNDYFRWAASAFKDQVSYGQTVQRIEPVRRQGRVSQLRVTSHGADGAVRAFTTRDLVVAVGGRPNFPVPFAALGRERVVHTSGYLAAAQRLIAAHDRPTRVAVIGGGQSGAEVFYDVATRFPHAEVTLVLRDHALRPADDSPFVNEVFDPSFVDVLHGLPIERRRSLLDSMRNTNYSVVNLDLIERIYALLYRQQVDGNERHRLLAGHVVESASEGEKIDLALRDTVSGEAALHRFDLVMLATGYRYDAHQRLLEGLADDLDGFEVDRFYRLKTPPSYSSRIYLLGCNEDTHGLSDTLLSILPRRAGEMVEDMIGEYVLEKPMPSMVSSMNR